MACPSVFRKHGCVAHAYISKGVVVLVVLVVLVAVLVVVLVVVVVVLAIVRKYGHKL